LSAFGITGGHKKLTPEQVCEYVGLWMAECARPFLMINDCFVRHIVRYYWYFAHLYVQLLKLFHPDVQKYLHHRTMIPKDIKRMYKSTQYDIIEKLAVCLLSVILCSTQ
jgi:hypothetical protein